MTTSPRSLRLVLRPVSEAAFAPFGWIVQPNATARPANGGTARRSDVHAQPADEIRPGCRLVTSIFEAKAQPCEGPVAMLERHPHSAQLIAPLGGAGHVVIVCLSRPDGGPDLGTLSAFAFLAGQGMIYRRGLWHHPILAIGSDARFLVQSWQDGTPSDCEIVSIEPHGLVATG